MKTKFFLELQMDSKYFKSVQHEIQKDSSVVKSTAALAKDLGSCPSTHTAAQINYNSKPRGFNALFGIPWAPGRHMVHRHAGRQKHP